MPINAVTPGAIRNNESDMDRIVKGLQIAETAFKLPVAYEQFNKTKQEARAAGTAADKSQIDLTNQSNFDATGHMNNSMKLQNGIIPKDTTIGASVQIPGADTDPNVYGKNDNGGSAAPVGMSAMQAFAKLSGRSPLVDAASSGTPIQKSIQTTKGLFNLQPGESLTPAAAAAGQDYEKRGLDISKSKMEIGALPEKLRSESMKPENEASTAFRSAIKDPMEQLAFGQQFKNLIQTQGPISIKAAAAAMEKMGGAMSRVNPESGEEFIAQYGGAGKMEEFLNRKFGNDPGPALRTELNGVYKAFNASIKDQINGIANQMAGPAAKQLGKSEDYVKNNVFALDRLFTPGKQSQQLQSNNNANSPAGTPNLAQMSRAEKIALLKNAALQNAAANNTDNKNTTPVK